MVALQKTPDGRYRKMDITVGEEEGGNATIEAFGFANADKDPSDELIVLLSWPVQHYDTQGALYEVRIFDDPKSSSGSQLTYLKAISEHFNKHICDCWRREGKSDHAEFKTIAAIKHELKKMGF